MGDKRPLIPQELGFDSWYHAYWHERHRADDLHANRRRWIERAVDAERELSGHDCAIASLDAPGVIHEWAIVGSVYRWGPFGYRHASQVTPSHFVHPDFAVLWSMFARGARSLLSWFGEVESAPWGTQLEGYRGRIYHAALGTVDELVSTVRDYLEIRRLTERLMELT